MYVKRDRKRRHAIAWNGYGTCKGRQSKDDVDDRQFDDAKAGSKLLAGDSGIFDEA